LASGIKEKNCDKRVENLIRVLNMKKDKEIENQQIPLIKFIFGDLNFRNQSEMDTIKKNIV